MDPGAASMMPGAVAAGSCLLAAATLVWAVRAVARHRSLLDHPNDRSAHAVPTPRLGGIGLVGAFLAAAGFELRGCDDASWVVVLGATAAVSILGLVDDLHPLPARVRLAVQAGLAVAVVWTRRDVLAGGFLATAPLPAGALFPLAVLWIVWMTNLYNFMDGIDGLAAGQAVIASAGLALGAAAVGATGAVLLLVLLLAASLGFLVFNFPSGSIFMGDVGSTAIGFFLACVPFLPGPAIPVEAVWIAVGLFVLDATWTFVRRVRSGERWFKAHRTHWYQRPLRLGVPHRRITLVAWAGMAVLAAAAALYLSLGSPARWLLVLAPPAVFLPLAAAVRWIESRAAAGSG